MAKTPKVTYVCNSCGSAFPQWYGRCPNCREWNSLAEEISAPASSSPRVAVAGQALELSSVDSHADRRFNSGLSEFDRVLGGGVVSGSAVLIGGEPGAGKSTLLLQACANMTALGRVLYVSGEESASQIKLRADRLKLDVSGILISNETCVESIIAMMAQLTPSLCVIDSIQTVTCSDVDTPTGSVTQIRESTSRLVEAAKSSDMPLFIVGHVNKDGAIAGPKVIEHIVDTVLYFEGDKYLSHRLIRAVKNRFGSTNEIGIFEMSSDGLKCVANPSAMLLEGRDGGISGSCVTCALEGTRPILCEIQSLAAKSAFNIPRRTSSGFDFNRTNLLLAVLEKRAGLPTSALDVYVNVAGGMSMSQPSVDLAVVASIMSSIYDRPAPENSVFVGEVGLGGEVRAISNCEQCVAEAQRLGYSPCIIPKHNADNLKGEYSIEIKGISSITELSGFFPNKKSERA